MRIKIHFRAFNSGGKGGQHGNRTFNAIEASCTLLDGTKLSATSQTERSQHTNRKLAAGQLLVKVREHLRPEARRLGANAGCFGPENRVRTYHEPDDRVTDGSGFRESFRKTVGSGEIGALVEERRKRMEVLLEERP